MSSTFNNTPGNSNSKNASLSFEPFTPRAQSEIKAQLASVWKQSLPIFVERLHRLDACVAAAETGKFTTVMLEEAQTLAHTFAGSLGMFGYPEGTDLARSMERWLNTNTTPDPTTLREYVSGLHTILGL
jgi:HPt (histidine-containing phosphotransfer) domain-containing protein